MKVYLTMCSMPYEGERVMHVCADKAKAEQFAAALQREDKFNDYYVDEWEVE